MATNARNEDWEYPSCEDVQRLQNQEDCERRDQSRCEDKVQDYLRSHPSASWAEAEYKTRQ